MSQTIYKGLVPSKIICFQTLFDLKINKTIVPSSHLLISHVFFNTINSTVIDQFYLHSPFLLWIIIVFLQLTHECFFLDFFFSIIKLYNSSCIQTLHVICFSLIYHDSWSYDWLFLQTFWLIRILLTWWFRLYSIDFNFFPVFYCEQSLFLCNWHIDIYFSYKQKYQLF
jgi:hypothetical protein